MKVFISWSGEDSRGVAEILRKYLPCMLQDVNPFMSKHDLASGVRWAEKLANELDTANFGIICLTPDNISSSWILFEAGALTKHVEGRACCLLLRGLRAADVTGPLSQFQNRVFERADVEKLIGDVNAHLQHPLEQSQLALIFAKWWPDLERDVQNVLSAPTHPRMPRRSREAADILDELLLRVRSIQRAVEPVSYAPQDSARHMLQAFFGELPQAQKLVLREFSDGGDSVELSASDLLQRHDKSDIDALLSVGFLVRRGDQLAVPHKLIAEYLAQKFNTSGPA